MGKIIRTDEATGLPIFERATPTVNVTKTNNGYEISSTDEATGLPVFKKKSGTTAGGATSPATAPKSFLETFSGTLGELAKGGADFLKKYPEAATGIAEWESSMKQRGDNESAAEALAANESSEASIWALPKALQDNAKARVTEQKNSYLEKAAVHAENAKFNEAKVAPALNEIVGTVAKKSATFFKNGIIDYEKVYNTAGELSKNFGGGDNVKEIIVPLLTGRLMHERRVPRVEAALDQRLQKEKGHGLKELKTKKLTEAETAEIEGYYKDVYVSELRGEEQAKTFGQQALKNIPGVQMGAGFISNLNQGIASKGSGLAAMGVNNSFTDWMRGFKSTSEKYEIPDNALTFKNIISDPVGTIGTRVAKQMGTMLPLLAAAAITRNPHIAGLIGFTDETTGLVGDTYEQVLAETNDPEKAKTQAAKMLKSQVGMLPTYFVESSAILGALRGGKGVVKNIVTENIINAGQELEQGYVQQSLGKDGKPLDQFLKDDAGEIVAESVIASTGMMGAMSGVGKVYAQVTKASPDAMQQHLASIIQQDGWMGASKHLNALYESGQINANEFNKLVTGGKAMSDTMKKMEADGIGKKEVLAAATLSVAIDKLQARHDAEKSVPIQKTISKKISAKQKELDGIMEGRGGFMTVEVAGGSSFVVAQDKAAEVMSGIKEQVADGTATITINPLQEETATAGPKVVSPEVQAFRENNPEYADLSDDDIGWAIASKNAIDGTTTAAVSEPVQQDAIGTEEQGNKETVPESVAPIEQGDAKGTDALGTTETVADTNPAPKTFDQPFITPSGKYKVITAQTESGLVRKVVDDTGKEVTGEPARKVLNSHSKVYDYNVGERAERGAMPDGLDVTEAAAWTIENSSNPAEIAGVFLKQPKGAREIDPKQAAIGRVIGKVDGKSFESFDDKNNVTAGIAKTYFKKGGQTLDQIAQEASNNFGNGENENSISPEDVANFIKDHPNGIDVDMLEEGEVHAAARDKFESLTGIPLRSGNNSQVAAIAASQFTEAQKLNALKQTPVDEWAWADGFDIENEEYGQNTSTSETENTGSPAGDTGSVQQTSEGTARQDAGNSSEPDSVKDPWDEGYIDPDEVSEEVETPKSLADRIRSFKSSPKTIELEGNTVEIQTKSLLDDALEIAAKLVEAGGVLIDAVKAGMEHIKASDFYIALTAAEQDTIIKEFELATSPKAPANKSTAKIVASAQRQLQNGKTAEAVTKDIAGKTLMNEADVQTIVQSAERRNAAPETTQAEAINTAELRETIINFGKELRKKYWQGVKEGGQNTAATFKGYEQMRDNIRTMITDMLRTTKKMGLIKGDLPANVWPGIIRRLTKAKTSAGLLSFYDYFKQVLKDVNYETKLTAGNNFRTKIKAENKRKSNDKNAATKKVYADFAKLDPAKVSDINAYLALAEKVLNAAQGIKAKATATTDATVKNESLELSAAEVNDYLGQQYDHMAEIAAQKLAEQYADMVEMGVIDPDTMTAAEMQEIMDAVNLDLSEEVVDAADIKHAADEKKMAALRAAVDYNRMGLADVDSPDMTDTQRKIVDELRRIDLAELTASQLAKLNDATNNILVNGDYTGAGQIAELADVQQDLAAAAESIEESGIKLGEIDKMFMNGMFVKGFSSTQLLNQFIFKLNRLTSEIQRRSGIHGIMSGHAKAKNLQERTVKQYEQLKKGLKDIDSALNKYRRGIYADVFNNFGGNTEEVAVEFERRKGLIQATAKALTESSDVKEQQEGALVQQVFNELLADSPDVLAVTSKMNAINPHNIGLVQFWQNAFDQRKAQVQENTEVYNNKIFEEVENYTATKYKGIDGEPGVGKENQVDNFDKETTARGVSHKMAGTKNAKTRNKNLPKGSVLNLDFDNVQSRAFYETNYDVFTAQAISAFKLFIKHPASNAIFGGKKNKQIVLDSMRATVLQQKGRNPVLSGADKLAEAFEKKVLRRLQAKGARIALGSIMQLPKQYISVATSTLVNLGTDAGLYFKAFAVSNKLPLFDQYAIGQRGGTQAGYNKDVDFGEINKADFSGDVGKAIEKVTTLGERIAEKIMTPLVAGDVSVARTSWLSYYMKSLQDQGIDIEGRDWANEHVAPNDEAAAFAEQMVSRSQNPNDASALGEAFKARGTGKLMSRIFMPFSTFSTNMRMRITNDMQKLLTGTAKAKKEAATSLAATVVETAVFNSIKVYAIQYLTTGLAHAIAGALGFRDDKDEEKEKQYQNPLVSFFGEPFRKPILNDKTEKVVGNSVSDLLFGGMGSGTQNLANYVMNTGWAAIADEQYADGKINRYPQLYYNFKGVDGRALAPEDFGIYGISIKKAYDIMDEADEAIFGKTVLVVKNDNPNELLKNKDKRVSITAEEQQAYALMLLIDALSLAGAGDAEISQANAKLKRLVDKKMQSKTRYGGAEFKIQVRGDEALDDSEE